MAVTVLPTKTPRVGQAISGTHSMTVMKCAVNVLQQHVQGQGTAGIHPVKGSQSMIKQAVTRELQKIPCDCTIIGKRHPALLPPGQDHVALRTPEQWGQVLTPLQLQCATQNARNVTLPSKQFVQQSIQRLHTASAYLSRDTQAPIIDDDTVTRAIDIDTHNTQYTQKYPWMCPNVFQQVNAQLRRMGLQSKGGVWDKEPCRVHATCSVHMQRQLACLTVMYPS